jgi:hypothetical protein
MANSPSSRIALGTYDPWRRTPSLEIQHGKIKFLPGKGMQDQVETTEAAFPLGARVEYRIRKGDMYFKGDHSQALGRTLWVIEPDGSRKLLASGFSLYVHLGAASRNLERRGIPFRVVSFYEGTNGEPVETELSTSRSRLSVGLFLASSNLWLGVIAGLFVHSVGYLIAIGALAFTVLAIATVRSAGPGRTAFIKMISALPTYAVGYAVAVVLARFIFGGISRR